MRALLHAGDPLAETAVVEACRDGRWRVREMAAQVLAHRKATSAASERALVALAEEGHPHARGAATRTLA